ncbi:MAG: hypothetical protein IJT73_01215 [Selenomonadaceae bacterium]|nr:hypothetical protein [Selenomonadaceae bacterium]
MKKILTIVVPLILVALVAMGVCSWQALQKVQTLPVNSLKTIREAAEIHDAETFYRMVDADKILEIAAEEILTAKINSEINSTTYSTLELSAEYENLREDFINSAKIALNEYLATGKVNFPADATEMQEWLKKSGVGTCSINNYSTPVVRDGVATAGVNFHNAAMNFDFEIEVTMQRINENEWRIIDARGFEGYFLGVKRGLQIKLNSLNAPIQDKIAETFAVKKFSTEITEGDEYGFSKTLKITLDADYFSEKPVERIVGRVLLDGRDGNTGITPFTIEVTDEENGLQTFEINKILNPFVKQDSDVMKRGLSKRAIHIEITEIDYLDGTILKEFERLPE